MSTQRFVPNRKVITQNIRTPGLDRMHRSFILRLLVVERVRCILDQVTFNDNPHTLIEKHLPIPPHYKDDEQKARYVQSESIEVMNAFRRFEQNPAYQEDLRTILPYKGHVWHLTHSSGAGVLITIEV
jgi:hypothetical protein